MEKLLKNMFFLKEMPMFCRNWPPSPKMLMHNKNRKQSSRLLGVSNLLVELKLLYFRPPPKKLQKAACFFFVEHCRITNSFCIPNFYYHTNLHGPLILLSSLVECLWMLQCLERCYQDSGMFHVRCLVQACLSINDWWWTFIENLRCPSSTYHQSFCNDTSCMHVLCHISPRPINFNKTKNTY